MATDVSVDSNVFVVIACDDDGRLADVHHRYIARLGHIGRNADQNPVFEEKDVEVRFPNVPATEKLAGHTVARLTASKQFPVCFRSEEHTSELQSLMRLSYAVFC